MEEKLKKQSINRLDIPDRAIKTLENNGITMLGNLIDNSKSDLKKMGLEQFEINKINIELQLIGSNLKGSLWGKKINRNSKLSLRLELRLVGQMVKIDKSTIWW